MINPKFWQIMDESALPHFCKRDHTSSNGNSNYCYSSDHSFHQQFYAYMKLQATGVGPTLLPPLKQQSFHVNVPETPSPMKRQIVGILEDFKKMDVSDSSCSGRLANSNPTRSQHTTWLDPSAHIYIYRVSIMDWSWLNHA